MHNATSDRANINEQTKTDNKKPHSRIKIVTLWNVENTLSKLLNKKVTVQSIPKYKWKEMLLSVGFTENTATNLSDMTQAVIDNKTIPERPNNTIRLLTTLEKYLEEQLKK